MTQKTKEYAGGKGESCVRYISAWQVSGCRANGGKIAEIGEMPLDHSPWVLLLAYSIVGITTK